MARMLGVDTLPVVPVRINFEDYSFEEADDIPGQLERVHEALRTQLPEFATHADAIRWLVAIRELGIHVIDRALARVGPEDLSRRQCLELVRPLLDATPSIQQLSGAKKLALSSSLPNPLVAAVWSAVHASHSLRGVRVILDATRQRADFMMWIAYALFCRDEPLYVLMLSECDWLEVADVEIMQQVVTVDKPLAMLFPELCCSSHEEGKQSRVAATVEVLLDHPSDASTAIEVTPTIAWADSAPLELASVGEDRDGYLPVLLPGWGKGWVPNDTPTRIRSTASTQRFFPPTRLIVEQTEVADATLALVRLLGHGLEHVLLQQNVSFDSLQFVLDAVDARQCPALTRLTFFSIDIQSAHAVDVFLQALATLDSKLANQLRVLSLQSITTEEEEEEAESQLGFERFRGDILVLPVPRQFVLAFLSIGASGHETPGKNTTAFQRFDSLILSRILGFTRTRHVRSVTLYGG